MTYDVVQFYLKPFTLNKNKHKKLLVSSEGILNSPLRLTISKERRIVSFLVVVLQRKAEKT